MFPVVLDCVELQSQIFVEIIVHMDPKRESKTHSKPHSESK